ncbi:hypothetical protein ACFQ1S_26145 [Kibdelosporangium lantanae]|uniref:DUF4229 domain-containing protein n=1 Tax=Kibdelosporangium lantanae TaxID=1497396 RepID=A0ABW3MGP0_9PSEU
MSSSPALHPAVRIHLARVLVVGIFAALLVLLCFLVPFWMVLTGSSVFVLVVSTVQALRRASRTVDTILREELSER